MGKTRWPERMGKEGRETQRLPWVRQNSRRRDVVELVVGYALILTGLWMPRGPDAWFYWAALGWVAATTALRFPGWTAMGLREKGLLPSLWIVAAALGLTAAGLAAGGLFHSVHQSVALGAVTRRYWTYAVWALVQEFLLLDFFLLRLCRVLPGSAVAVGVLAVLFAVVHIPNPVLVPLVLLWGIIAGALFLRYRNLYTLALAHAILGICVAIAVPAAADHQMRVGLGYLTYRPHQRNPNDSTTHNTFAGG